MVVLFLGLSGINVVSISFYKASLTESFYHLVDAQLLLLQEREGYPWPSYIRLSDYSECQRFLNLCSPLENLRALGMYL